MKKLLPLLLLALFCVSSWAQTVPELTTDKNNPKLYTIASYNRGGYLTSNGAGQGATHVAATRNSYWYFTAADGNTEGTAANGVIMHCIGDNTQLATNWTSAATGGIVYILPNGVNKNGLAISKTATISSSSCMDANNYNTGVGSWKPTASDWQGTTWVFAEVEISTEFVETNKSEAVAIINTLDELAGESATTAATTALNSLPETPMSAFATIVSTLNTFYGSLSGKKFTYRSEMNGGTPESPRYMKAAGEATNLATSVGSITAYNVFEFENVSTNIFKVKVPYYNNVYLNSRSTASSGSNYELLVFGEKVALQFQGTANAIHHQGNGNVPVSWETAADASKWYIAPVSDADWTALTATPDFLGLQEAINNANNYTERIGSELHKHSWIVDEQNRNSEWTSTLSTYQAIVDAATASVEEVNTAKAAIAQMIQQLQINLPKNNSLIRIKGTGTGYLQAETATNKGVKVSDETGKASMFFYTDGKLLSYGTGYYLFANASNYVNMGTTPGEACSFRFGKATKSAQPCYTVIFNGNRYLHAGNGASQTDAGGSEGDSQYNFLLEYVTDVPIAMNEMNGKYYATIQLPVAVVLPAGMKAYKATAETDTDLKLEVVADGNNGDVLAANTPAILYSTANVESLAVSASEGTPVADNMLSGTVAAISAPANSYVLSGKDGEAGFYRYAPTTNIMPGFKAYLSSESASSKFSFVFADEDLTAIADAVKEAGNNAAIYDIQGRKVVTPLKGSVYIQGGKKIVY